MSKEFDSWKGFLDAGFEQDEVGALSLGDEVASCSVTKDGKTLQVTFASSVTGHERFSFEFPQSFDDMYAWAAFLAGKTFGSKEKWCQFCETLPGAMVDDLKQMYEIGCDHLDDMPESVDEDEDEVQLPHDAGDGSGNRRRLVCKDAFKHLLQDALA